MATERQRRIQTQTLAVKFTLLRFMQEAKELKALDEAEYAKLWESHIRERLELVTPQGGK